MMDDEHNTPSDAYEPRRIAKLIWEEGEKKIEKFISSAGLTIGRGSENDLAVRDLGASRFHCKILPENETLLLVDLDSTNGTFLNGEKVAGSRELYENDKIRIGQLEFLIEILPAQPVEVLPVSNEMPFEKTFVVLPESKLPRLVVSSGMGRGTEFSLTKERMLIGRASSDKKWDIDLVDKAVSRPHAELVQKNGEWVLTDLNSANGTTLNGARVTEPHTLQDGDTVSFGETILIFRLNPGA